jgi:RNA polymerase sigma factor (sigma-70 family)
MNSTETNMALSEDQFVSRFDAQPTRWSMVQRAHQQTLGDASAARQYLVMRYSPAIRSYVRAITRDEDQADDIAQDVIVRLLSGDFAGADPLKGKFRDLLKTAVRNMIRNMWAKQKVRKSVEFDVTQVEQDLSQEHDAVWDAGWQQSLLSLAWRRLEEYESSHQGSIAYQILKLRADYPDDSSEQLSERLGAMLKKPVRADQTRQQLRRARVRFAEFLVEEIADILPTPTPQRIEDELSALGLLEQIRDVLPAGWSMQQ